MSFQKCPICKGSGIEPLATLSSTKSKCLVCDGRRIISKKTGLPPNKVRIEKPIINLPESLKEAQIVYATESHLKELIDELDKTGELPYHLRPTNPLKRTEQEKDQIRLERELDLALQKIDKESGIDIFSKYDYIRLNEEDLKTLNQNSIQIPTQNDSHIQTRESHLPESGS